MSASTDTPDAGGQQPDNRKRLLLLAEVAVVLLVIGFLLKSLSKGDDDTGTAPTTTSAQTSTPTSGGATAGPSTTLPPPEVTLPPGREVFTDGFERADGPVGNGWKAEGPAWSIVGKGVALADNPTDPDRDALIVRQSEAGGSAGSQRIEGVPLKAANGLGIVFRYRDPKNYWKLIVFPDYATWELDKTVSGVTTKVDTIGPSAVYPGMRMGVQLSGNKIEVLWESAVARTYEDPQGAADTGFGVTSRNTAGVMDSITESRSG